MGSKTTWLNMSAARLVASTYGILAGVGGMTHGVGEILQGNVAPAGLFIPSWTEGPIATQMGGDPAITIVPNLLATGILTLLVSLALMVWSAAFVHRKHGGWVLIALSVTLLLVGGGIGSPVIGILAGVAGLAIHAHLGWWRAHLPEMMRLLLARLWPWVFGITLLNGLFLFVGALILVYSIEINNADLFLNSFYFAVLSLLVTLVTAVAYDIQHRGRGVPR